ncbi:nuclear transport factor 2 family protein, partial [Empedobacter brevis]|uniref:nuclear transport factor 2 family protein n=1 Tax=Empedobacter brevis TaxID=247 RepID=UPI0028A2C6EE
MTPKQIAAAFSNGNFEQIFPYLADNVQWTVVGEDHFDGKPAVMNNCNQITSYFKSVTTHFKTLNVIADNNRIAI